MYEATSSQILAGVGLWGWWGIWGTCCDFWRWYMTIIFVGISLMQLVFLELCWYINSLRDNSICSYPITWSSWWRWRILLSLWWLMFLCTWCILCPHMCVSFSRFICFCKDNVDLVGSVGGKVHVLKKPGGMKNMHSVFKGFLLC